MMTDERPTLSMKQQAELIDHLADRCLMRDGSVAKESFILIETGEAEDLRRLASRLRKMAPYESAIRDMVMRK